jgi:uncharacterized membrane protein YphA (DoxX/SURF4 family)
MDLGVLVLVGRVLIGGAFLVSGIRLLKYLPMVSGLLAAKGVPYPRFVAATAMAHDFWNEDGMQRFADINAVIANTIIVGALLALAGLSP